MKGLCLGSANLSQFEWLGLCQCLEGIWYNYPKFTPSQTSLTSQYCGYIVLPPHLIHWETDHDPNNQRKWNDTPPCHTTPSSPFQRALQLGGVKSLYANLMFWFKQKIAFLSLMATSAVINMWHWLVYDWLKCTEHFMNSNLRRHK